MNVALRQRMSLAEFLAWEERQELRHEFDGFQPYAMVGGTAAHASFNETSSLPWRADCAVNLASPFGSELKIEVAGSIRYPDAFVVCSPVAPKRHGRFRPGGHL